MTAVDSAPRLLLAEDDADTLDCLSLALSMEGYQMMAAASLAEALALIQEHPFDVILTDFISSPPGPAAPCSASPAENSQADSRCHYDRLEHHCESDAAGWFYMPDGNDNFIERRKIGNGEIMSSRHKDYAVIIQPGGILSQPLGSLPGGVRCVGVAEAATFTPGERPFAALILPFVVSARSSAPILVDVPGAIGENEAAI